MKSSDAIAILLSANKVCFAFELIGGMITHIIDSIQMHSDIKIISMRHEQGAAFAAGGVSRASKNGEIGLALGTSGPGATNLITGIADCWLDSVPCIFITGQVNTNEQKGALKIRQQGFQELDIISLVASITKYAKKVEYSEQILPELQKAIDLAKVGRPGPVLLDIPMDLQQEDIDEIILKNLLDDLSSKSKAKENEIKKVSLKELAPLISKSNKPLFLFGGGIKNSKEINNFIKYLEVKGIPYVASLKGSENIQSNNFYLGMIGSYGTRLANNAIQKCDLLFVLGSRLDVRQTGANVKDFSRNAAVVQIDIDKSQLSNRIKADLDYNLCIDDFLNAFTPFIERLKVEKSWSFKNKVASQSLRNDEYSDWDVSPHKLIELLTNEFSNVDVDFVADVGNNQMWLAHSLRLQMNQQSHHSGGLGAMGFCIPTAIGVHYAIQKPVIAFTGDGGAQLNIQELDVIAREYLPILVIILNNQSLGMVKNFQELYFDGRNSQTYWNGYSCSFSKIADGYNLESSFVTNLLDFKNKISSFANNPRPFLIEMDMKGANECRPRLAFGDLLDEQSPKIIK